MAVADVKQLEELARPGRGLGGAAVRARRRRAGRAPVPHLPRRVDRLAGPGPAGVPAHGRRGRRRVPVRPGDRGLQRAGLAHLRLRPALRPGGGRRRRPGRAGPGPLPGGVHRDLDRPGRERRLQRPGPAGRSELAAGHGDPRLRQVPAPGRHDLQPGADRVGAGRQPQGRAAAGASSSRRSSPRRTRTRRRSCGRASSRRSRARWTRSQSLDDDRILRSLLKVIRATLRTNFFQTEADGSYKPYASLQARPARGARPARAAAQVRDLGLLPAGRGRAPALRRGGARRPALVRPPRGLPHRDPGPGQGADGEERRDRAGRLQGRLRTPRTCRTRRPTATRGWPRASRCYKTFISGLLDITDNLVDGEVVPPAPGGPARRRRPVPGRRRRQGHRDVLRHRQRPRRSTTASGSATPSPPAARSATTTRAWASPPAARGSRSSATSASSASTPRTQDFTVVGVGDMSGDVFGNGMLLSEHIRLVAAFDHRHIFLDPNPDAEASLRRARPGCSTLPRSSWADYDASLISAGGGVYPRSAKSMPITPQVRAVLGLEPAVLRMTPDRADARDPEGPGGPALERRHRHLRQGLVARPTPTSATGPTTRSASAARTCAARSSARAATSASPSSAASSTPGRRPDGRGGRINTDAIDNSAGVDTSDHEVNIKILLDQAVARRRADRQAAQHAAGRDDRRSRARWCCATTSSRTSRWPTPPGRPRSSSTRTAA